MTDHNNTAPRARKCDVPRLNPDPIAAPQSRRSGRAETAPIPRWSPHDKEAAGHALGLDFREDPDNAASIDRLRAELAVDRQLRQFDPTGELGMAHRLYSALRGEPEWDTSLPGLFLGAQVHHEVFEFWAEVFGRPATDRGPKLVADWRSFADSFVAAVLG